MRKSCNFGIRVHPKNQIEARMGIHRREKPLFIKQANKGLRSFAMNRHPLKMLKPRQSSFYNPPFLVAFAFPSILSLILREAMASMRSDHLDPQSHQHLI